MNTIQIREALQDLIYRLQDAEKGYKEITKATANVPLQKWLKRYANERHIFHGELENHVKSLGGDPEVQTTFLGKIHRMFIDIKISNIEDDFGPIVNEIERGSNALIGDYRKVLQDVKLPLNIAQTLRTQVAVIEGELNELLMLKEELQSESV